MEEIAKKEAKKVAPMYEVKMEKTLKSDGEKYTVSLTVNEKLQKLLTEFAVKTGTKPVPEIGKERYLAKKIVVNSWGDRSSEQYLFVKELIDTGTVSFEMTSVNDYKNLCNNVKYYRDFIKFLEETRRKETTTIRFVLDEEVKLGNEPSDDTDGTGVGTDDPVDDLAGGDEGDFDEVSHDE